MAQTRVRDAPCLDRAPDRHGGRVGERRAVLWTVLGAFAVVTALGIRAHTLWFDELQAWNIARASGSLGDLASNLRYEGHPIAWYLPLYALTRVTGDPHAMQVMQFLIAVGTAALVLFRAPFRLGVRVALLAGYFLAFEYGVLSRSYGLGVLLLVAALVCLARPAPRWGWGAAALVALACTSLPGAVLSVAVAVTVAGDRSLRAVRGARRLVLVTIVAAAMIAITCVPPADFGDLTPGIGDSSRFGTGLAVRIASSASAGWRGLVPLPATVGEWNTNFLDRQPGAVWVQALLSVGLFAVVLASLGRYRFARRLWCVGAAGLFVFFVVVTRPEAVRHAGFVFLLFLACAWFAKAPPATAVALRRDDPVRPDRLPRLLVVVLAAQVLATATVYPSASAEDFSRDRVLADAIRAAGLEDAIVSAQDWDATTVGGYLDRSVYSLARGTEIRFVTTDERQERGIARLRPEVVECSAVAIAQRRAAPIALVTDRRLAGRSPLAANDGAAVYEIGPADGATGCAAAG